MPRAGGEFLVEMNLAELKQWAGRLKFETYALYLAYRDPRVPLHAKLFVALVVGYAFSPIDLIPDSIPVLGYLDDLILVPLGVALAVRMIPEDVLSESRRKAKEMVERGERPVSRTAAAIIVALWLALAIFGVLVVVWMVRG
ncbi:YkvA family protein [soil metagenome]